MYLLQNKMIQKRIYEKKSTSKRKRHCIQCKHALYHEYCKAGFSADHTSVFNASAVSGLLRRCFICEGDHGVCSACCRFWIHAFRGQSYYRSTRRQGAGRQDHGECDTGEGDAVYRISGGYRNGSAFYSDLAGEYAIYDTGIYSDRTVNTFAGILIPRA